ncbi:MAG TPA: flagellar basal body rod C-terminal domain-containing protein, partial [Methylovirgula sp.]|nr:flagellar basal body rod C-terminal domain-containing protein [Methylovirgula sp.]
YTRKVVTFADEVDRATGADLVKVDNVGNDRSPFHVEYDPGNPAADSRGFVKLPNVNLITELADMREANRSYTGNIEVIKQSRELYNMTVDLLKNS